LIAFLFSRGLGRLANSIDVLDAAGLSLFAVPEPARRSNWGVGPMQAIILGAVTGVGGGTVRDVLIRQIPAVLSTGTLWSAFPGRLRVKPVVPAGLAVLVVSGSEH
jgi:uncharacterized membrane protein YeiH